MKKQWFAIVPLLVLVSCVSVPYGGRPESVQRVVDLINAGNDKALAQSSSVPFLFDGEIVELREDVQTLWSNVVSSNVKLADAQVIENRKITSADTDQTYKVFADSFEAKTFLQKYLPKNTVFVRLKAASGMYDLLLDGAERGAPLILGFKAE